VNLCRSCGEDFGSIELFDSHRVGAHSYTYTEGVAMSPTQEDGRRCLSIAEMGFRGWRRGVRGRWIDPVRAKRALGVEPQALKGIREAA
jgi:hypothetical protein